MPDNDVWPPKPDLPDPLTEYDEVIAEKIAALPKVGAGRLSLIKTLRDEEGMDLRQAYTLVNSYCERHGAPFNTKTNKMLAWSGCAGAFMILAPSLFNVYLGYRHGVILNQPHHRAALLALDREMMTTAFVALSGTVVIVGISLMILRASRKR